MMAKSKSLGRVELELLQYIDEHHPVSVREVADYWAEKTGQARTTVLTMMERLKDKGFLSRKKIDNVYHYSPKQSISAVMNDLVQDFVHGVLGGSLAPFVAYLNGNKNLAPEEIEQLKRMVSNLESQDNKGKSTRGKQS
jgi:BlaI family transcriptional regulator, penicillinase repressor